MTRISLPYGDTNQTAEIDESIPLRVIDVPRAEFKTPVSKLIEDALDNPIGTKRLEDMVRRGDKVTVIVNDQTRPGPNIEMLTPLVRRLNGAGVSDDAITFVIATGSHRAPTEEELDTILGKELHKRIAVHIHDCLADDLVDMGKTESGLPVWLNKHVAEADFIVTTGLIAPHHAAGYSGGRKSIVPGVVGLETLKIHHSLPIRQFEPAMGFFEGNPFHESALEAALKVNVRFMINTVQDVHKQNVACVAGDLVEAHKAGAEICKKLNTIEVEGLSDVIITSPGGAPRDCNLYQAQKALSAAERFAKKSGVTFILCAQAKDGIGEGLFRQWMKEADSAEEIIERFKKEGYNVGSNKAFMYARALLKGRIIIVSENTDPCELKEMKLGWAPTLQEAVDAVIKEKRPELITVIPRAANIIPEVKGN